MKRIQAIGYALAAAVFYALSIPCAKLLLEQIAPTYAAALLYLGAGIGVGMMYLPHYRHEQPAERLTRKDLPYTIGMILLDIIAPILLMIGVRTGSAANASLLGNFEIVATTVIALLLFREKVSKRLWAAIVLILIASMMLSFSGAGSLKFSVGSLFVLGAAACWGLENNCTRSISEKSTYQIVTLKGFGSGLGSMAIAFFAGEPFPQLRYILPALLLGFVAYGLSIFTYIRAQSSLGAAKTSAYYAAAPFIGVFLSFVLLHEPLTIGFFAALLVMLAGTVCIVIDTLAHAHTHAHTHTITHTHGGSTHTHTITHTHEHAHCLSDRQHTHTHSIAELESLLTGH